VKNNGIVPVALVCGLAFCSWVYACPRFVEFFPDPKNVSDQEGEYVEIRMDEFRAETLFVQFESKEVMAFAWPNTERFVLVHDTAQCESLTSQEVLSSSLDSLPQNVSCGSLGKVSLPNSRESVWRLLAGSCVDSVTVPHPKPGKVIERVGMTDEWAFVDVKTVPKKDETDSLLLSRLFAGGVSPLRVTEVHHCPEEPMPEWVELYNAGNVSLPLELFRFCDRGGAFGMSGDSILPFQTVLVSKDTASLRSVLAIPDIRMIQVSLGFLNNNGGTLRLCMQDAVIDSVSWDKGTVACPSGFNPLTGRREFTPGYQKKNVMAGSTFTQCAPFSYKLSSRVVSKKGSPLRVLVESEYDVVLSLLDSAGRRVWKTVASANSNEWLKIPAQENLGIGVGFVSLSVGEFEDVVGILVRP